MTIAIIIFCLLFGGFIVWKNTKTSKLLRNQKDIEENEKHIEFIKTMAKKNIDGCIKAITKRIESDEEEELTNKFIEAIAKKMNELNK